MLFDFAIGIFSFFFKKHRPGQLGEKKAVRYLKRKKHRIVTTNFRTRRGEIDIISTLPGLLIFTEVKSGSVHSYRHPFYSVNSKKIKRIKHAAESYRRKYKMTSLQPRYDIITVIKDDKRHAIDHYENAIRFY